jgi:hypothetical protein
MIKLTTELKVTGGFYNTTTVVEISQVNYVKFDKQLYINVKFFKSKEDFENNESEINVIGIDTSKYFSNIDQTFINSKPILDICEELYQEYLLTVGYTSEIIK